MFWSRRRRHGGEGANPNPKLVLGFGGLPSSSFFLFLHFSFFFSFPPCFFEKNFLGFLHIFKKRLYFFEKKIFISSPGPPASDPPPPPDPLPGTPAPDLPPPDPLRQTREWRQPENSKRAHLRVAALQTPPKFHVKTPRERKRAKMGAGVGKTRNFGPPRLRTPTTLRAAPLGPHPWGPHTWGPPQPFGHPHLWAPPFGPHPSGGALRPPTFSCFWAPTFLIFIMLLICSFFVHF